ncbi:hypothetical protein N7468_010618 [Penicillium chermesinum]|uniref:Uncharacterized protein n=1 Tax=Penicillium chermesinum TaxID=63820 RepID=A0A9W9TA72_9EURO|nr:uncharacterized protein N7468_010618 [Penicillium chermesinum]KAJ5214939.1 hypothetical protein N7468_010618 [Penicillium chermesinum]KAJ6141558.1 hypothetical protein N7470_009948 [Penicillium chermesinum]
MTTISHHDEQWTFFNNGPVTTTFTPAPTCLGTAEILLGTIGSENPYIMYSVQCDTTSFPNCVPTATATPSLAPEDDWSASVGSYYSPGLYCPSGWATVGQAGRDGDKPYTTSGAMSWGAKDRTPYFDYMPTLLAKNLQPSETVALCCPSGYTADILGGCYNTVPSYTPTQACAIDDTTIPVVGLSTAAITTDGTVTEKLATTRGLFTSQETYSVTWGSGARLADYLTPFHYVTAVTLIHHESDIPATSSAKDTSAGAPESTSSNAGAAATTSNAAARTGSQMGKWHGSTVFLGGSLAAAVLGAAIIL